MHSNNDNFERFSKKDWDEEWVDGNEHIKEREISRKKARKLKNKQRLEDKENG